MDDKTKPVNDPAGAESGLNVGFDPKNEVDALKAWRNDAAAVMAQFINLSAHPDEQEWGVVAIEAIRLLNMGSNV